MEAGALRRLASLGFRSLSELSSDGQAGGVCGVSGHGLSACWRLRPGADDHNGELRHQRGDGADGGEERSQDGTDGSDGHGNLDERVAVLVLYHDALDIALVDQVADLIDQVAGQDMNFFHNTFETHSIRLSPRPAISSQAAQYRPSAMCAPVLNGLSWVHGMWKRWKQS